MVTPCKRGWQPRSTKQFHLDYGRIITFRSATGMGIRLDGGTAYSGGVTMQYYDSLLVKVTASSPTPQKAINRMIAHCVNSVFASLPTSPLLKIC